MRNHNFSPRARFAALATSGALALTLTGRESAMAAQESAKSPDLPVLAETTLESPVTAESIVTDTNMRLKRLTKRINHLDKTDTDGQVWVEPFQSSNGSRLVQYVVSVPRQNNRGMIVYDRYVAYATAGEELPYKTYIVVGAKTPRFVPGQKSTDRLIGLDPTKKVCYLTLPDFSQYQVKSTGSVTKSTIDSGSKYVRPSEAGKKIDDYLDLAERILNSAAKR